MQQKELKEGSIEENIYNQIGVDQYDAAGSDDLAPYLPDVSSIETSQVLETCASDFQLDNKGPIEADSFENDDVSTSNPCAKSYKFGVIF